MMDTARMILSELTLKKLPKIPSFSAHLGKIYWEAYKACGRQWNAEELERVQTKRLRAIIKHAYEHVEYYHNQFDSIGVKPEDIKKSEDLCKLPILSKQDLRTHFPDLIATNYDLGRCTINKTSGTTGEPTTVLSDEYRNLCDMVAEMRRNLAWNIGWRERFLDLSNERWRERYLNPSNETSCPHLDYKGFYIRWNFKIQPKNIDYLLIIEKYKPTVIFGHYSLIILAHTVQSQGDSKICPKVIINGYELLDNSLRGYYNNTFGAEVFDLYGCTEAGWIAWECPKHEGYHIDTDNVLMEFIKDGELVTEGERGKIIITTLHNYAMPLIRYEVGDVGTFTGELCSCGRKFPIMKSIEGRTVDLIVLPDGQIVSPHEVMSVMQSYQRPISKFQIIQENKNLIIIKFIEDVGFNQTVQNDIEKTYQKLLGDDVDIKLIKVKTISREKSGKLRPVISKVHNFYNSLDS